MAAVQDRHELVDAVAQLASGIAHDLNNALQPVRAYGEIALMKLDEGEDVRPEVEELLAGVARVAAVIRRLLAFSGRQIVREDVVEVGELVRRIAERFEEPPHSEIALVVLGETEPVYVVADPHLLQQAIVELVVNARTAMPEGGILTLQVSVVDGEAIVAVKDTGRGMDAETVRLAFRPFSSLRSDGEGWGLGLATAYGIVTQSGGGMAIESDETGTSVVIRLPLNGPGRNRTSARSFEGCRSIR